MQVTRDLRREIGQFGIGKGGHKQSALPCHNLKVGRTKECLVLLQVRVNGRIPEMSSDDQIV